MSKLNHAAWLSLALLSGFGARAAADEGFDNRFYVAPMVSSALTPNSRNADNAYGGGVAFGKSLLPHLGVELLGDYLYYKGSTVNTPGSASGCGLLGLTACPGQTTTAPSQRIYGGGLGANLYLSPSNYGFFLHGDAEGGKRFVYNGGLGADLRVTEGGIGLRLEALYHKEAQYAAEPLFRLGLRIPLGSLEQAPVQPAPAPAPEVVPVEQPAPAPEPAPAPAPPPCQMPAPGQPISLEGCKTGDTIVLHGVNFEFNKATLTVNAKTLLDQVADALLARKDIKVEIDGHTDGKGGAAYNQKLSEARAASVKKYLVGRGIDEGRMTTKGFGKSMPVADNGTDEGRELNRRVELKVTESANGEAAPTAAAPAEAAPAAATTAAEAPATKAHTSRKRKHKAKAAESPAAEAPAAAPPANASSTPPEPPPADAAAAPAAPTPASAAEAPASPPPADTSAAPASTTPATPEAGASTPPSADEATKVPETPATTPQ
jgi:OOP family OmpA-OmpF porin